MKRLDPNEGSERVANFINSMTMEMALLTRSLGRGDVHRLEPEDLAALTIEAFAMAQITLVGTDKVFGGKGYGSHVPDQPKLQQRPPFSAHARYSRHNH